MYNSGKKSVKKTGNFSILEDRALPSEGRGQRFESSRVRHFSIYFNILLTFKAFALTYFLHAHIIHIDRVYGGLIGVM
jgi:hypothetical protein